MEQVGERQDFEAQLSRLRLRHEDFCLQVRRANLGRGSRMWNAHYAVRVSNTATGKRNIYWGGPGEDWVAQFVIDANNGLFGVPVPGWTKPPVDPLHAARPGR